MVKGCTISSRFAHTCAQCKETVRSPSGRRPTIKGVSSAATEERRAQLVECALTVAGRNGVDAVTVDAVAHEAGLPTGVVCDCFGSDESLRMAMGETLIRQLGDAMGQALAEADAQAVQGPRGLRIVLHNALTKLWQVVEGAPERNVLLQELNAHWLRQRTMHNGQTCGADNQYRLMDRLATAFLDEAARRTGTAWLEPVSAIAQFTEAVLDGLVARWLVDRHSEAIIIQLDDLASILSAKAVPAAGQG